VHYDPERVRAAVRKEDLIARPPDLWRDQELLPVKQEANRVCLGEGLTPLRHVER
jgi:threonine synthase